MIRVGYFCAFLLLVTSSVAKAQVLYGSLTGNVTDSSGGAVPGAQVKALNDSTGVDRQSITNERGVFLFNDLQRGSYSITIDSPGFSTVVQEGVSIEANTVRRMDVVLQVSQVSESVTITADAAVLHGRVTDVAAMIDLSRRTMGNIHQNIAIALGLKAVFLVTTIAGITGLWPAILADTGATVLVTLNALRLLSARAG